MFIAQTCVKKPLAKLSVYRTPRVRTESDSKYGTFMGQWNPPSLQQTRGRKEVKSFLEIKRCEHFSNQTGTVEASRQAR